MAKWKLSPGDWCHIEFLSGDAERSKAFYRAVFDWEFQPIPGTDYINVGQKWLNDDVNVVLTTNKLNIAGNNFLVQQYDFVPSTDALPIVTDGTRTGASRLS